MTTSPATPSGSSGQRALVLAGGGAAGNAWEIGVIAGLHDAGLDVTRADLVIGTSAGSTVAVQVTAGTSPSDLYAAILAETPPARPPHGGPDHRPRPAVSGPGYLEWSNAIIASASDPADMRRRLGAAALERDASGGADARRWREVVASRLPGIDWPRQRVLVVAVDAESGEPVVFDRDSGVDLVDAVAASTSAMTPYEIDGRRFLNGGYRRSENADLAAGCGRVLVMSPFAGASRMPPAWGMDLATQVAELRAGGSAVETVFPDAGAGEVFDANALDPATRLPAARGGYAQGRALAGHLAGFWG
ncbi:patatin-like phospholipase family protein [Intrasporangium flavum]|uniref:patatin-like phospholipase family protein n=1 Tax=Intrasporangium flavum TaxID=1428657 RepID=UPI00096EAC5B|nr:patatin-like phospholipase family protein [Intrasporangium flavum]